MSATFFLFIFAPTLNPSRLILLRWIDALTTVSILLPLSPPESGIRSTGFLGLSSEGKAAASVISLTHLSVCMCGKTSSRLGRTDCSPHTCFENHGTVLYGVKFWQLLEGFRTIDEQLCEEKRGTENGKCKWMMKKPLLSLQPTEKR